VVPAHDALRAGLLRYCGCRGGAATASAAPAAAATATPTAGGEYQEKSCPQDAGDARCRSHVSLSPTAHEQS